MKKKLTNFMKEYGNIVKSFLLALFLIVNVVLMIIDPNDTWSKVFSSFWNLLEFLMQILTYVCVALVVCCIVLVITALIYCALYEDKDIAKEKEEKEERYGR